MDQVVAGLLLLMVRIDPTGFQETEWRVAEHSATFRVFWFHPVLRGESLLAGSLIEAQSFNLFPDVL
jgi:hypothetical protein